MTRILLYGILAFLLNVTIVAAQVSEEELKEWQVTISNPNASDASKLDALIELAYDYELIKTDSALILAEQALLLGKKLNDERLLPDIYTLLGSIYDGKQYSFDTVVTTYQKGIKIAKKNKDIKGQAKIYNELGLVFQDNGQQNIALKYYKEGLQISEQVRDTFYISVLLNNIGLVFIDKNDWDRAKIYFQKALRYSEQIDDQQGVAYLLTNLGMVYHGDERALEGHLDSALILYEKSLKIKENIDDEYAMVETLFNIGEIYLSKKLFDNARQYFNRAYEISKKFDYSGGMGVSLSGLAELELEQKQYGATIEYAKKALNFLENGDIKLQIQCYDYLSEAYEGLGQFKLALFNNRIHQELKDSVYTTEKIAEIEKLEIQYEVKQKDAENELLKAKNQANYQSLRSRNMLVVAVFILAVILGGWSFYSYKNSQERKMLNEELQAKNEALKAMDETKTRFFANVSHELKTPLTLIMSPLQRLRQHELSEEAGYLVKAAEKSSHQLYDMTQQILELTKFEVNKVTTNLVATNLHKATNKLYADFESLAERKQVAFEIAYDGDKALNILTDYSKLVIILRNLLSNALKFTPSNGSVQLLITEHQDVIEIRVTDTGRGIHADDLSHIFDRYYQAKKDTTFVEGGTGIGLAICREYVKLLDGTIRAESELGKGSSFIINLPKVIADASHPLVSISQPSKKIVNQDFPNPKNIGAHLPTLLVVEDNIDMQEYLQLLLQSSYRVVLASNGKEALSVLDKHHKDIHLILSDLMMPEMNGYELITVLKDTPNYAGIPVIMLTALSGTDDKLKALRVGIDDYITKPFVDAELLARIDNLIDNVDSRKSFLASLATADVEQPVSKRPVDNTVEVPKFAEVVRIAEAKVTNPAISKKDLQWLEELEQIVKNNYNKSYFTIDVIGEMMSISRMQVHRKVKAITGMTPKGYINEIRFREARTLLEKDDYLTVKAIALSVGFKDEKYFSRLYKKRYGRNPRQSA